MNFRKKENSIVDSLVILAVFCVFALTALFVVLFGAKIYRNNVNNMSDNFGKRTGVLYITERIRANDEGSFCVIQSDFVDVLVMTTDKNNTSYNTYLYVYDNALREYTNSGDKKFDPKFGQPVLDLSTMNIIVVNDKLLHMTITYEDGETEDFFVSIKNAEGGLDNPIYNEEGQR